jgi:hypothetical protein
MKRRWMNLLLGLGLALGTLSGCVVRAPAPVVVGPGCAGAVWEPGHYGPAGVWHPGHWRCANGVIVYR